MTESPLPSGVVVTADRSTLSATAEVEAPAADVFEYVRRPANHAAISGDRTVTGARFGPERPEAGDRFGMTMKMFGVPYRMSSTVRDLESGRRISWAHVGGHEWSWTVEPLDEGRCRVTETFDLSTARVPAALRLLGFPGRHKANVARSVANVAAHFAAR